MVGYITPGLPATGRVGGTDDGDLFRLNVQPGRSYRLTLTGLTGHSSDQFYLFPMYASPPGYVDEGLEREPGYDYAGTLIRIFEGTDTRATVSGEFSPWAYGEISGFGEGPAVWHTFAGATDPADYSLALTDITDLEDRSELGWETTTGTVAVGGSVTGTIDVDHDVDWFRVALEAETTYRIKLRGAGSGGGTLADPYLRLMRTKFVLGEAIRSTTTGAQRIGTASSSTPRRSTTRKSSSRPAPGARGPARAPTPSR